MRHFAFGLGRVLFAAGLVPLLSAAGLLPTEEQKERWARPRPEPVTLDLPGWTKSSADDAFPNQHAINFENGACSLRFVRDWDLPLDPGYPVTIEEEKSITVAGRSAKLTTMTQFGAGKVQVVGLHGKGYDVDYQVLIRFRNCADDVIEDVLKRVEVRW